MVGDIPTVFRWLLLMGSEYSSNGHPPRAQRFDIHLPLRYRAHGETAWHEGRTENMSGTGVLFMASHPMQAGTQVEMSFTMPAQGSGEKGAEVACQGEIVRTGLLASDRKSTR